MPITGIALHTLEDSVMTTEHHAWLASHGVLAFIFVVFAVWHLIIVRHALLKYLRNVGGGFLRFNRELWISVALVAIPVILLVSHAFL